MPFSRTRTRNPANKVARKAANVARRARTKKSATSQAKQIATLANTVARVAKLNAPSYCYMKSYYTGSFDVTNGTSVHLIRPSAMYTNYVFQRPEAFDTLQGVKIKGIKVNCTLTTNTESSMTQVTTKLIRYNKQGIDAAEGVNSIRTTVLPNSYVDGHDYIPIIARKRIHTLKSRTDYIAEKTNYSIAQGEGSVAQPITNLKDIVKHWSWYIPLNTIIKSKDSGESNVWSAMSDLEVHWLSQVYIATWTDNSTLDAESPKLKYTFIYDLEGRVGR